jgi:hypothetical protein
MWILNFLPAFVVHIMLIIGILLIIASIVLTFVPFISTYNLPIQLLGILLTVISVWYEGGIAKDAEYKAAIAELELKIAISEKQAEEANSRIDHEFMAALQSVTEMRQSLQAQIRNVSSKIDAKCTISPEVVDILNSSAKKPKKK